MSNEHLPEYRSNSSDEDKRKLREIMMEQIKHIAVARPEQQIKLTCICGKRVVVWMMYRCLFCGIFFCKECAEVHFGQRRPAIDQVSEAEKVLV